MSDKKEKVLRFDIDEDGCTCSDNLGDLYYVEDVHEAIKKSIDNDSVEMIKADLVAYFGLELEK